MISFAIVCKKFFNIYSRVVIVAEIIKMADAKRYGRIAAKAVSLKRV
jgi:hypothetical protein